MPFRGLVTTNYDTCFESACRKYGVCPELLDMRWFCFPEYNKRTIDMKKLFDGNKFLLHMHGCFCYGESFEIENIILAPSQYMKFYRREEIRTIISTLSKKHVVFVGTSLTDRYFLDAVRELRKPRNDNERANSKAWFKLCDNGKDCFEMRDEEDFIMHHIHYKRGKNGFSDTIMKMVDAVNVKKNPVSVFVDPSKI
jgi:hypothetical protein